MSGSRFTNPSDTDLREGKLVPDAKQHYRRVGAIDIGSNSIHLLIASINPILNTFTVDLAEKLQHIKQLRFNYQLKDLRKRINNRNTQGGANSPFLFFLLRA